MQTSPYQALELLYTHATHSRNLPPAALPELNELFAIIKSALEPKSDDEIKT